MKYCMRNTPRFNTNSEALSKRIEAHEKFGEKELNAWIFSHLEPKPGMEILDLGAGRGKQSIDLARIVGPAGHIRAVDISEESLRVLRETAEQAGVANIVEPVWEGLDDFPTHHFERIFDRVVSSYALYYSEAPDRLFPSIYRALKGGGIFFFCGPSGDNNREIKDFQRTLADNVRLTEAGGVEFMEETGRKLAYRYFDEVLLTDFENPLRFNSPESLYAYWSSYNLYDQTLDEVFRKKARQHFEHVSEFLTVKRVRGIRALKSE